MYPGREYVEYIPVKAFLIQKCLVTIGLLAAITTVFGRDTATARATEGLQDAGGEAAKMPLREKLKEAASFSEKKYSFASWMALRAAMDEANQVLGKAGATAAELQTAHASVQKKIETLQERTVSPDTGPRLALSASLFATERKGPVNNVAIQWATTDACDSFEVHRAVGTSGSFTRIYSGRGASFNDYSLGAGTYSYKMVAYREGKRLTSNVARVTTTTLRGQVTEYSNQTGDGADTLGEPLKVGRTYYRFPGKREGKTVSFIVQTSPDGKVWKDGPVVLDASSHPDLDDFKFEANNIFYDKKQDRIVWWCHWERSGSSYAHGRAMVATARPGERFTVHRIFNPLGVQVRDMSVFVDEDGKGYLVAASNVAGQGANATLYLFTLNADLTDVTGIANKAMENEYREAPHIVRTGGFYYLFFSQAAGWYPSRAGYVSARSLAGRWSEPRSLGNTSTFSAQSGAILDLGNGATHVPVLMANRWIRADGTSRNSALPLQCVDGFAFGDYAPTLLLEPTKNRIVPLQAGRLLSQDQPASSSIPGSMGHEAGKAFDGDYTTSFQSDVKTWPFSVTTDLGGVCTVRNVQISWHLHKGSEAYYKYTIEGSQDGKEWRVLLDRTDEKDERVNKTYGFSSDLLPGITKARYIRINVHRAVLHNNPNNWYPPTLYEVKVYGDKSGQG